MVDQRSQRKNVRALIDLVTETDFRRQVAGGADELAGRGQLLRHVLVGQGNAEIGDPWSEIDKAMAALLGKAYDFDRFCRIGGGLLLASLISIAAVLLVTVVYNIVNLAYLHRVNKMEKAEVPTLEETKVQRWNRALPVIHRVYAALSYLSLLICLGSVVPLSMISGAALGAKTAGDSATASSIATRAKIAIVIGFVLFFIIAVRGITKKWDRIKANGPLVCPENLGTYLHGLVFVSVPFLTVLALALLIVILLVHLMLTGARLTRRY